MRSTLQGRYATTVTLQEAECLLCAPPPNIEGRFEGIDSDTSVGGTTTDVAVVKNAARTLFSADVKGFGATAPFSMNNTVAAGSIIDFVVGYGSNNTYANDSTGLSVTITPTQ